MPQHDRNDEDFWTRSRRTRQSDKRSKRGRKRKDNDGTAEIDWTDPDLPSAAPPTGRARRESPPPAPGPEPALPQRPVPPRVAAAQRPEPFLNDPPIGGGPGSGARRGGQPAPLGSSEPGAGFAGGRRDRSHADMPTQALPAFGPPTPGPSGRPDTGRAPGTARRRAREAEGWSDGSSTNGPHLASGRSRPPALGAPSTSSLVPGMPRSGGHGADAAAAAPLPDDRTSSLVPGMRRSDSRDQADPGAPGASGRRSGRSAASQLDAGAPGASGRRSAGRQLEPGAPGGSGRRAAAPQPGPGSGRRPALSPDEGPGGSGRRAALSPDEGPGGSGRRAALSPDEGPGGSGRRPAMLQ
ncbi:MAG TPA: hypothetical protein VK611_09000, partial [Acidimicrobiales bacterium]|nr:hypothetical protein [Acidimicrobiales bacterium]